MATRFSDRYSAAKSIVRILHLLAEGRVMRRIRKPPGMTSDMFNAMYTLYKLDGYVGNGILLSRDEIESRVTDLLFEYTLLTPVTISRSWGRSDHGYTISERGKQLLEAPMSFDLPDALARNMARELGLRIHVNVLDSRNTLEPVNTDLSDSLSRDIAMTRQPPFAVSRCHRVEEWDVGNEVDHETCAKLRDAETEDLYAIAVYAGASATIVLTTRACWEQHREVLEYLPPDSCA